LPLYFNSMNYKFNILFGLIIIFCFVKCTKPDSGHSATRNVDYYLTPSEKLLLSIPNLGDSILFFDSITNNQVYLNGTFRWDITSTIWEGYLPGEIIEIYYTSNDTLYQNLGVGNVYELYASSNSDCFLEINSGEFFFDPNNTNKMDSIFSVPYEWYTGAGLNYQLINHYKLLDSISFANYKFYNVFNLYYTDTLNIRHNYYYTRNQGIVGFPDNDNNFWIRGN
jgi:hypothetical protein